MPKISVNVFVKFFNDFVVFQILRTANNFFLLKMSFLYLLRQIKSLTDLLVNFSVLIATNDVAKISDFGTSKQWNEKSTKMSFAGTVAWMAPEVIRNEPCSDKIDIWYVFWFSYQFV